MSNLREYVHVNYDGHSWEGDDASMRLTGLTFPGRVGTSTTTMRSVTIELVRGGNSRVALSTTGSGRGFRVELDRAQLQEALGLLGSVSIDLDDNADRLESSA